MGDLRQDLTWPAMPCAMDWLSRSTVELSALYGAVRCGLFHAVAKP